MKKRTARIIAAVMAICALMSTAAFAAEATAETAAARPAISICVNDETVAFPDAQPYVDENGRTMVPVRFVAEALKARAIWDAETNTATLTKSNTAVSITIGDPELKVSGEHGNFTVTMDTTAVLKDGRTFIPVRFIAEAFGCPVEYDAETNTAHIYDATLNAVGDGRDPVRNDLPTMSDIANVFKPVLDPIFEAYPELKDYLAPLFPKA